MGYDTLVKLINFLVKLANKLRLLHCTQKGQCICKFCENENCRVKHTNIMELK